MSASNTPSIRLALWPICALFGHEAEGLMRPVNTHDAMLCGCGRRMVSNVWRWSMWSDLR